MSSLTQQLQGSGPTTAGWSWLPQASSQRLGSCLLILRPMSQLSKDASYLRVTTGALTLKADGKDLPDRQHPPPGVHQTLPFAWEMESFDFFLSIWSKSLGRSRPIPALGSLPEQQSRQHSCQAWLGRLRVPGYPASYSLILDWQGLQTLGPVGCCAQQQS